MPLPCYLELRLVEAWRAMVHEDVDRNEEWRSNSCITKFFSDAPQQCRIRVAKRMPSETLFNSKFLSLRTAEFSQNGLAPGRFSAAVELASERPIFRHSIRLLLSPGSEDLKEQ